MDNLIYLVADTAAVNTCLADLLGIPMIGCAIHMFNLAFKKYLESRETVLQKIQLLMTNLRQVKQARTKTDLEPLVRNQKRWSSTYEMLNRFFRLYEFIDKSDEALATHMPTPLEMITLKDVMKDLEQYYFRIPNEI